ncbi:phosphoadenylyl-sulfate reductase [Buchnera aphidicola (Thelaxes californica)]|uniref:Phosphoadenosine 5'-phosphosulfate reductase n=1 Tax=Buchnera aphidicola (Thelaxes californica) TaxID=1315998 RepID=A0A4D6YCP8_9GAMM|nr:phosphoadenylyl-sulfate reductase [Buchnera aphidicola]QCI26852.1 phosphoadenylyl-sulfate reductase [Buchnera aphidicola (Thelaxes californica)]
MINLNNVNNLTLNEKKNFLYTQNIILKNMSAKERISWALENLPGVHILTSSFGIHSLVSLHLMIQQKKDIPVVIIDTGYLFPETYHFIDKISKKLELNLKIFRPKISSAWQEVRYGKLWKKGLTGIELYNNLNKVDPMKRALKDLSVNTWFAGLRFNQSNIRSSFSILNLHQNIFKFLPIFDWNQKMIDDYTTYYQLDIHPLYKKGYISVGDIHTTIPFQSGMLESETRFFGLKRECGLHEKNKY